MSGDPPAKRALTWLGARRRGNEWNGSPKDAAAWGWRLGPDYTEGWRHGHTIGIRGPWAANPCERRWRPGLGLGCLTARVGIAR